MAYNLLKENVEKWRPTLQAIYDNAIQNKVTVIETDFPIETRWHLRQAIASAVHFEIEPFCKMVVKIKKRAARALVVYPSFIPESIDVKLHAASLDRPAVKHGVSSMLGVLNATLQTKEKVLSFPDLEPSLLTQATAWAEKMGHKILNKEPFTIQRNDSPT